MYGYVVINIGKIKKILYSLIQIQTLSGF